MTDTPPESRFIFAAVPPFDAELQKLLPDPQEYTLRNYVICGFRNAAVDSSRFIHPEHRCIVDWFRDRYQPELDGVHASEFDPVDVKEALGSIVLLEKTDDPEGYRYRLYGSRIAETYGSDLTGRTSQQLNTESTRNVRPQYLAAVENNIVVYTEHDLRRRRETNVIERWDRWSRLIVPLLDADGSPSRLLVSMVPSEIPYYGQ